MGRSQGVAVRLGVFALPRAKGSAHTRDIDHDHGLTQVLASKVSHHPHEGVGSAAGAPRN